QRPGSARGPVAEAALWQLGADLLHPVWSCGVGFTDCMRERGQPAARARRWTAKRSRNPSRAGGQSWKFDPPIADGKRFAFADRRIGGVGVFVSGRKDFRSVGSGLVS